MQRDGILLVEDGNHGEYRPRREEITAAGRPHIRAADLTDDGRIDFASAQRINEVAVARIRKGQARAGDVIVSHKGTVGRVALAHSNAEPFVCSPQTTLWRTLDDNQLDRHFLFALLRSPWMQEQFRRVMHESDMAPYVSLSSQREFKVLSPPIAEQRAIVSVLSALDDKIESNRRIESLCAAVTSELFGEQCVRRAESDWTKTSLADIAAFVNGKNFTRGAAGYGRPVLRIKELNSGLSGSTAWNDVTADPDNVASHYDLLFAWSGSLGVHRWDGPAALINQHIFKVIPASYPTWWVECWLRRHLQRFRRIAKDKAVTMGHIRRADLREATVVVPPLHRLSDLDTILTPMDQLRASAAREARSLAEVRDALLPKLVSGQIRVPLSNDPEEQVGAAIEALA